MKAKYALKRALRDGSVNLREQRDSPIRWYLRGKEYGLFALHRLAHRSQGWKRIMDEPWDILLILDACRSDLFMETADPGQFDTVETRYSGASATKEWVVRQFGGRTWPDTMYLTANPVVSRFLTCAFYMFVEAWEEDELDDDRFAVLNPERVAERARDLRAVHPEKQLNVHFTQPHYPFLEHPDLRYHGTETGPNNIWEALRTGEGSQERVWEGYRDNLERALDAALPLANEFEGRTVVTSDHGNLLGEQIWPVPLRQWGHSAGLRHTALTDVPWATVGELTTTESADRDSSIETQLEALGHR